MFYTKISSLFIILFRMWFCLINKKFIVTFGPTGFIYLNFIPKTTISSEPHPKHFLLPERKSLIKVFYSVSNHCRDALEHRRQQDSVVWLSAPRCEHVEKVKQEMSFQKLVWMKVQSKNKEYVSQRHTVKLLLHIYEPPPQTNTQVGWINRRHF